MIKLYQFVECPYCEKVRQKLVELKLEFQTINVSYSRDDEVREMLFTKTGVHTVPVIEVDGKFIGDSGKIIEYLDSMVH